MRVRSAHAGLWPAVILTIAAGCSRTGTLEAPDGGGEDAPGPVGEIDAGSDAGPDAATVPVECTPSPESCNGLDDDCDGVVDEDVPTVACEGGGVSACVAGRMSACPRRCDVCIPGSERVCFISYCTFWGVQRCAMDGRGFGPCVERRAPGECLGIARDRMDSPELEQCCIDNGYCCLDRHDLDGDGNSREPLGDCADVLCGP